MKRLTIIGLMLLASSTSLWGQWFPVDTLQLNRTYNRLIAENGLDNQQAFFRAFPSTWEEFTATYQYAPAPYDLAMYNKAHDHIGNGLRMLTLLPDSIINAKLLNIATRGTWAADAPSYLLSEVRRRLFSNHTMAQSILSLSNAQQYSFWRFWWSGLGSEQDAKRDLEQIVQVFNRLGKAGYAIPATVYQEYVGFGNPHYEPFPHSPRQ